MLFKNIIDKKQKRKLIKLIKKETKKVENGTKKEKTIKRFNYVS